MVTAALALTVLVYMMYNAFGFAAFKAAAPFIGTVGLVFAVAHYLDRARELEDAKERGEGRSLPSKDKAPAAAGSGTARKGTAASAAVPRRRRVAD